MPKVKFLGVRLGEEYRGPMISVIKKGEISEELPEKECTRLCADFPQDFELVAEGPSKEENEDLQDAAAEGSAEPEGGKPVRQPTGKKK